MVRARSPDLRRVLEVALRAQQVRHASVDLGEATVVVEGHGERFRQEKALLGALELPHREEGVGQIEPQLGGLLARLTALGEMSQSSQRLLVAGDRVPLGVAQRGQDSRLGEIDDGLGPGFALPVVGAQGKRMGLERPGVEGFERLRHPAVEKRAARGDELTVHHLADAVVRELEALAAAVQDPMAHQLLDAFRDLGLAEIGRPLQQGEVEGPADDRRDGQQAPASVAEPLQAVRDQVADTLGKRQRRRVLGQGAPAQGAQRLDDHEGVSAAGSSRSAPRGARQRGVA